jgi:hypothetical protein
MAARINKLKVMKLLGTLLPLADDDGAREWHCDKSSMMSGCVGSLIMRSGSGPALRAGPCGSWVLGLAKFFWGREGRGLGK